MAFENMSETEAFRRIRKNLRPASPDLGKGSVKDYNLHPSLTKIYGGFATIPNNAVTSYGGLNKPFEDTIGMWTGNSITLTIPRQAFYLFTVNWFWDSNAVGTRLVEIAYNGTVYAPWGDVRPVAATGDSRGSIAVADFWNAGDTFSIVAFQNSGGGLNLSCDVGFVYLSNL